MRSSIFAFCLIALLALSTPAQAQLRSAGSIHETSVRLYDQGSVGFSLSRFFTPQHFQMSHSFEMSSSSFGGGSTMSMYTNSMRWHFNSKLAARLDVSAAYSPLGDNRLTSVTGRSPGQVFISNAEIAYRPSENVQIYLSMRRSPYGSYMSPYGSYGGRGYGYDRYSGSSFHANFGPSSQDLFWNNRLR